MIYWELKKNAKAFAFKEIWEIPETLKRGNNIDGGIDQTLQVEAQDQHQGTLMEVGAKMCWRTLCLCL